MTPDLQLTGADVRLGGSRLVDAPATVAPRPPAGRLLSRVEDLGPARSDTTQRRTRDDDLENAEVSGPALTLTSQQLEHVSALFKLISDKTRLAILQILCEGEMNVTALCRRLKLPQPTVSHHLGLLRMHRLIANRRSGKQVYYKLHERVEPVMLPQGSDGKVKLDGAVRELGEHPTGLQIVDEGFAIQLITSRRGGSGIYPKLDGPVRQTTQSS